MKYRKGLGFEESVWKCVSLIPKEKISTYKEIALALGNPLSARAVGNACAKNPFAPRIPCHRVVCSDGRLGGYSSGISKKVFLLEKEGIKIKNGKVLNFAGVLVKARELKEWRKQNLSG